MCRQGGRRFFSGRGRRVPSWPGRPRRFPEPTIECPMEGDEGEGLKIRPNANAPVRSDLVADVRDKIVNGGYETAPGPDGEVRLAMLSIRVSVS